MYMHITQNIMNHPVTPVHIPNHIRAYKNTPNNTNVTMIHSWDCVIMILAGLHL